MINRSKCKTVSLKALSSFYSFYSAFAAVIAFSMAPVPSAWAEAKGTTPARCESAFERSASQIVLKVNQNSSTRAMIEQNLGFQLNDEDATALIAYRESLSPRDQIYLDDFMLETGSKLSQDGLKKVIVRLTKRFKDHFDFDDVAEFEAEIKTGWRYFERFAPLVRRENQLIGIDVAKYRDRIYAGEDAHSASFQAEMDQRIAQIQRNKAARVMGPKQADKTVLMHLHNNPTVPFMTAVEKKIVEAEIIRIQATEPLITKISDPRLPKILELIRDRRRQILDSSGEIVDLKQVERAPYGHLRAALFDQVEIPTPAAVAELVSSLVERAPSAAGETQPASRDAELAPHFYSQLTNADHAVKIVADYYRQHGSFPTVGKDVHARAFQFLRNGIGPARPDITRAVERLEPVIGAHLLDVYFPKLRRGEFCLMRDFDVYLSPPQLKEILREFPQLKTLFSQSAVRHQLVLSQIYEFFLKKGRLPVGHPERLAANSTTSSRRGETLLYQDILLIFKLLDEDNRTSWTLEFKQDVRYFFNQLRQVIELYSERERGLVRR